MLIAACTLAPLQSMVICRCDKIIIMMASCMHHAIFILTSSYGLGSLASFFSIVVTLYDDRGLEICCFYFIIGKVIVRCAQLGTCIPAKVFELSTPEGDPLTLTGLVAGASLLLDVKGKSYPVTFVCNEGVLNYS